MLAHPVLLRASWRPRSRLASTVHLRPQSVSERAAAGANEERGPSDKRWVPVRVPCGCAVPRAVAPVGRPSASHRVRPSWAVRGPLRQRARTATTGGRCGAAGRCGDESPCAAVARAGTSWYGTGRASRGPEARSRRLARGGPSAEAAGAVHLDRSLGWARDAGRMPPPDPISPFTGSQRSGAIHPWHGALAGSPVGSLVKMTVGVAVRRRPEGDEPTAPPKRDRCAQSIP